MLKTCSQSTQRLCKAILDQKVGLRASSFPSKNFSEAVFNPLYSGEQVSSTKAKLFLKVWDVSMGLDGIFPS